MNFSNFQSSKQLSFSSVQSSLCVEYQTENALSPRLIASDEYINSIEDTFSVNLPSELKSKVPPVLKAFGFDTNATNSLDTSSVEKRYELASEISAWLLRNAEISTCQYPQNLGAWDDCIQKYIQSITLKLYRRPITSEELGQLKGIYNSSTNAIPGLIGEVQGYVDSLDSNFVLSGWARDTSWEDRIVDIHIYAAGANESLQFVTRVWTGNARPDVNAYFGIEGNHGWSVQVPAKYADGKSRTFYVFAIGKSANPQLSGSGKTMAGTAYSNKNLKTRPSIYASEGLTHVLTKILSSPQFLLNTTSYELNSPYHWAARIGTLARRSVPDAKLLELASKGQLGSQEAIKSEIARGIDEKTVRFVDSFFGQLQGYRDISSTQVNATLLQSLQSESQKVAKTLISKNMPLSKWLKPGFSVLNSTLSKHYEIPLLPGNAESSGWEITQTENRGGLLNQGSFALATSADNSRTEVIRRGRNVLATLLCEEIQTPSPELFNAIQDSIHHIDANLPVEKQLEVHRSTSESCYKCHSQMDPIGLGLQNLDYTGKWRSKYSNGHPINTAGNLLGTDFSGPEQLTDLIASDARFPKCFEKQVSYYASVVPGSCSGSEISENTGVKDIIVETLTKAVMAGQ